MPLVCLSASWFMSEEACFTLNQTFQCAMRTSCANHKMSKENTNPAKMFIEGNYEFPLVYLRNERKRNWPGRLVGVNLSPNSSALTALIAVTLIQITILQIIVVLLRNADSLPTCCNETESALMSTTQQISLQQGDQVKWSLAGCIAVIVAKHLCLLQVVNENFCVCRFVRTDLFITNESHVTANLIPLVSDWLKSL